MNLEFPPIPEFCTLRLAEDGALAACCADYEVPPPTISHSVLEEARAAARLFQALLQDSTHLRQEVFHRAPMAWPT